MATDLNGVYSNEDAARYSANDVQNATPSIPFVAGRYPHDEVSFSRLFWVNHFPVSL